MISLMGFVGKFWAKACPENASRVLRLSSASEPRVVRRCFEVMLFPLTCVTNQKIILSIKLKWGTRVSQE
jgi:hypothetical protein